MYRSLNPSVSLQVEGFLTQTSDNNIRDSHSNIVPAARLPPPPSLTPGHVKRPNNAFNQKKSFELGRDQESLSRLSSASQPSKTQSRSGSSNFDNKTNPSIPQIGDNSSSLEQGLLMSHSLPIVEKSGGFQPSETIIRPLPLTFVSSAPSALSPEKLAPENIPDARREQHTRVTFFDAANQTTIDRLISGSMNADPHVDGDDETAAVMMSSVEEMIEGYEWASDDVISRNFSKGAAAMIEARLLDELLALEKANIHSFLESDDRMALVVKYLDESISQLDNMDSLVSSYKIHLNSVSDDIQWIQSQNRGLQVQTQNQRALLHELQNLLKTVNVDQQVLITLTQESLEKPKSIERLEEAATELYKALQAGRETEMAATMERLQEYRNHNHQFCKRLVDFLSIMFTAQSAILLGDNNGVTSNGVHKEPVIMSHQQMETYLGRYSGLMLYLKEMDEEFYSKLCATYFSAASALHGTQTKVLFTTYLNQLKKTSDDYENDFNFIPTATASKSGTGIRRGGTARQREKERMFEGYSKISEAFRMLLEQLALAVNREEEFITDFLHINDAGLTFADYMGLDNYFRRQALRALHLSQGTMKFLRGAIDLIFGFLPAEIKAWVDRMLENDEIGVFGLILTLERFVTSTRERSNQFLFGALSKQLTRLKHVLDRHIKRQIDDIEQTKLSNKRRQGVASFVKQFPTYVERVESQLRDAGGLEIRTSVDAAYEKIVQTIFDSLKHIAKLSGEGEDKGQLNYHIIMIENMHHFVAEASSLGIDSISAFLKQAESMYDENLGAYVKIVIRRHFTKIIDYFEAVERLLKITSPSEVSNNNSYSKSALRKVVKEYNSKDVRKHIEAMHTRIGKHFADSSLMIDENGISDFGAIFVDIWKACEEEVLRITELFSRRIIQCYGETGITLDYTTADVEGAFRRHGAGF